jgi:tRNA 2-thiouridine synthesizing protein A
MMAFRCPEAAPACAVGAVQVDRQVDARGLNCPLSILRMASGQVVKVLTTDPASARDFHAFSRQSGHALLASDAENSEFVFFSERNDPGGHT